MKAIYWVGVAVLTVPLALAGCGGRADRADKGQTGAQAAATEQEGKIKEALAKLSPEERTAAEAQQFCAVQNRNRLGSMGTPVKVMIKGQPVFLCCDHCEKQAKADPEKTLSKVEELKAKTAGKTGKIGVGRTD